MAHWRLYTFLLKLALEATSLMQGPRRAISWANVEGLNYRIWIPKNNLVVRSAFFRFDETTFYNEKSDATPLLIEEPNLSEDQICLPLPKHATPPINTTIPTIFPDLLSVHSSAPGSPSTDTSEVRPTGIIPPPLGNQSTEKIEVDTSAIPPLIPP